jgi:hypothetical protein
MRRAGTCKPPQLVRGGRGGGDVRAHVCTCGPVCCSFHYRASVSCLFLLNLLGRPGHRGPQLVGGWGPAIVWVRFTPIHPPTDPPARLPAGQPKPTRPHQKHTSHSSSRAGFTPSRQHGRARVPARCPGQAGGGRRRGGGGREPAHAEGCRWCVGSGEGFEGGLRSRVCGCRCSGSGGNQVRLPMLSLLAWRAQVIDVGAAALLVSVAGGVLLLIPLEAHSGMGIIRHLATPQFE